MNASDNAIDCSRHLIRVRDHGEVPRSNANDVEGSRVRNDPVLQSWRDLAVLSQS
jgi:hypothetical protein